MITYGEILELLLAAYLLVLAGVVLGASGMAWLIHRGRW